MLHFACLEFEGSTYSLSGAKHFGCRTCFVVKCRSNTAMHVLLHPAVNKSNR